MSTFGLMLHQLNVKEYTSFLDPVVFLCPIAVPRASELGFDVLLESCNALSNLDAYGHERLMLNNYPARGKEGKGAKSV
jgi:hypothetical protein